jgi:hypothetical protein
MKYYQTDDYDDWIDTIRAWLKQPTKRRILDIYETIYRVGWFRKITVYVIVWEAVIIVPPPPPPKPKGKLVLGVGPVTKRLKHRGKLVLGVGPVTRRKL